MMSINFDNASLLVQVAREAYRHAVTRRDEANAYREEKHMNHATENLVARWLHPLEAASRDATVVVVFSGMAIESFINSVGAQRLSSSYFKKYLDKLEVIAKWVIVPGLADLPALDPGGQLFERLRQLVKDRNALVHGKYRKISIPDELLSFAKESCDYMAQAKNAISVFDGIVDHFGDPVAGVFRESSPS